MAPHRICALALAALGGFSKWRHLSTLVWVRRAALLGLFAVATAPRGLAVRATAFFLYGLRLEMGQHKNTACSRLSCVAQMRCCTTGKSWCSWLAHRHCTGPQAPDHFVERHLSDVHDGAALAARQLHALYLSEACRVAQVALDRLGVVGQ